MIIITTIAIIDYLLARSKIRRREFINTARIATQFLTTRTAFVRHGTLWIVQVIACFGRSHAARPRAFITALHDIGLLKQASEIRHITANTITHPASASVHYPFAGAKFVRREIIDVANAAAEFLTARFAFEGYVK